MPPKEAQQSDKPTRRQIALSKKEREQQRLIYTGLGLVGALVLIVLAIGLVQTYVIEPNSPVGSVNGEQISTRDYRNRVLYDRFVLEDQYQQVVNEINKLPADEKDQFSQYLRNQYQQYATQISQQRAQADRQAFNNIVTDRLVAIEAAKRKLTVTDAEVTENINRFLAARQGGYTAAAIQETSTAQAAASATAALWTPTPTFTPSPTPTTTHTISATATLTATQTPAPTATPKVVSPGDLSTEYNKWITAVKNATGLSEAQYRDFVTKSVLRSKLRDILAQETPKTADHVHLRHIQVETKEAAQNVIKQLNSGVDFASLAKQLSKDTSSAEKGGDLGFIPKGRIGDPDFEKAVFALPLNKISDPIESQVGWHVVEVLAKENRELDPYDYAQLQRSAFDEWLATARQNAKIEDLWTPEKAPADPLKTQNNAAGNANQQPQQQQ